LTQPNQIIFDSLLKTEMVETLQLADELESLDIAPLLPDNSVETQFRQAVLTDYETCVKSREVSLIARKEVLGGKAKFGITGDGKEVPQVAMARAWRKGDWRSGYYRDQTLLFALGMLTIEDYFAQLYADCANDPSSGGRQMNAHFATPSIHPHTGEWTRHTDTYNSSSDLSCTAGQMARGLGLAVASKKYRENPTLRQSTQFSDNGNEVCFVTIGDGSTSEGVFFESLNAAGVMRVPMAVSIWDDGYAISVPAKYQTTKGNIGEVLKGFATNEEGDGIEMEQCEGWNYPALCALYERAIAQTRVTHTPVVLHITELTQPQGHSTSGSHERYKSTERLEWEKEYDCIKKMREWILEAGLADEATLVSIEINAKATVKEAKKRAWQAYITPVRTAQAELIALYETLGKLHPQHAAEILTAQTHLKAQREPFMSEVAKSARQMAFSLRNDAQSDGLDALRAFVSARFAQADKYFHSFLYSDTPRSALKVAEVKPVFSEHSESKNGYEIINTFFDKTFETNPLVYAFGEDVGKIGDVNQGFAGLQDKYGEERIFDTGIREWTIMGKAIGMAMRGLRPIAEIQYLDYILYGISALSDDLAMLRYRSAGIQAAPAIIRTRGHRLEGIWHAGSPMAVLIHALRGMYVCVPRNMTQAAGMYATLLRSDDPALVIECLNGYRQKELLPDNIGDFTVPLGVVEVLEQGSDLTLVTYGSCVRIAQEAIILLKKQNISVELIDIQTLLPFDIAAQTVESLKKTNRLLILDEDVPGGASAYLLQEILEKQNGYQYLDAPPRTLTAHAHRTPYGSDGDYFTKPSAEDVITAVVDLLAH
jgi:pyruvate/2-oxoglutarate/acetoin dehydrogenase E1 component/TPP-dependent pyruvate/acetoin dehydrogenase alpha subunit